MDSDCYHCSKAIKSLDFLQCRFCDKTTHLKCVGLKRSNSDFINEQANVLWFCENCIAVLDTLKENSPVTCDEIVTGVSEAIKESLVELRNEIHQTKQLTESLASKTQQKDTPGINLTRSVWPSIKRSRSIAKDTPRSRPDV